VLLWYDKEFDRLDAPRTAPQEGVPPVIAGEAGTISANRRLSFLTGFRDAAGRMSTDVRNWHPSDALIMIDRVGSLALSGRAQRSPKPA
jgi:hypothetical protein